MAVSQLPDGSKGFIHTLEAVIASAVILSMVLFVYPEIQPETEPNTDRVREAVERIDQRNNLSRKNSVIEEQVDEHVRADFNVSIRQVKSQLVVDTSIEGNESFTLDNSTYKNLMLWTYSNSGLSANFSNSTVIDDYSGVGYLEKSLSGSGTLNFSGKADGYLKVMEYPAEGSLPRREKAFTVNYITDLGNRVREVRIRSWR